MQSSTLSHWHLPPTHFSSPTQTYTTLMQTSTRLNPDRIPYVTHRMINDVAGISMKREWEAGKT